MSTYIPPNGDRVGFIVYPDITYPEIKKSINGQELLDGDIPPVYGSYLPPDGNNVGFAVNYTFPNLLVKKINGIDINNLLK
jgi:hypothetical protein